MNELIVVRINANMNKFGLKGRRFQPKNIQLYINDLLNIEKYVLEMFNKHIEVYKLDRGSKLFFGSISRENNKKIFDRLSNIIRIKHE